MKLANFPIFRINLEHIRARIVLGLGRAPYKETLSYVSLHYPVKLILYIDYCIILYMRGVGDKAE